MISPMRSRLLLAWLIAAAVVALAVSRHARGAGQDAAADSVPVGVAKIDITPDTPIRMYGYGSRQTESEGIAGRLFAKALAIGSDQGQGPAVLLMVDIGALRPQTHGELLDRLRPTIDFGPGRFIVCHTHCHSAPDVRGMESIHGQQREHLERYMRQLIERLEEVVRRALASRRPARLAWSQGEVAVAANRRVLKDGRWVGFGAVPEAPVDHSLPVLRVANLDGSLRAVVFNYACHCTTLRGNFKQIHGDWAASAQEDIEADHPGTIAITSIGCGADADPCPHGTVELCRRHGRAMADEVARLLKGPMTPIEPRLTVRWKRLEFACAKPRPREELRKLAGKSYPIKQLLKRLERGETPPDSFPYEVATWVFGDDLAMVFLTGEVVVDYALRMKREMDGRRLWITAYAHDVPCYVVSKRLLGEGGYEVRNSISTWISYGRPKTVAPAIEDRIVAQVRALLPEGFRQPGDRE